MKQNKSGQVSVTFNWIYVLIAGAVILLFFLGIIIRQKNVSEERLSIEVLEIMQTIFTGAEVSEQTKNFVGTSSLADHTLYFECNNGVTVYGLRDANFRQENSITPIFSPEEIKSSLLILWSVPYKLPFKIMDFLFITSANTKYYLLGDGNGLRDDFLEGVGSDITDERLKFNIEEITNLNEVEAGNNFQVRIVDFEGSIINNDPVPGDLNSLGDKATAVSFSANSVQFFEQKNNIWQTTGSADIVSMNDERDAAKFAAIFSADAQQYDCNMNKAFQRVNLLSNLYEGKLDELKVYYDSLDQEGYEVDQCKSYVNSLSSGGYQQNLEDTIKFSYKIESDVCASENINCATLSETALGLRRLNQELGKECEVALY